MSRRNNNNRFKLYEDEIDFLVVNGLVIAVVLLVIAVII
jgi:hypothetical protein